MKLEVGMYVRLINNDGMLGKIITITNSNNNFVEIQFQNIKMEIPTFFIKKASHNIIDLIELNDIVQIKENIDNHSKSYFIGIDEMATLRTMEERIKNNNLILESILTKEQFENNCYTIGDE